MITTPRLITPEARTQARGIFRKEKNMTYEIESGIEIPEFKTGPKKPNKYPWQEMEVGQSFFLPDAPKEQRGYFISMAYAASRRYAPKKFTQRAMDGGLRIWRVE